MKFRRLRTLAVSFLLFFVVVQFLVGTLDETVQRIAFSVFAGTAGHPDRFEVVHTGYMVPDGALDFFSSLRRLVAGGPRHEHNEFISAPAHERVGGTDRILYQTADLLQDLIPRKVAEVIVDALEIVD